MKRWERMGLNLAVLAVSISGTLLIWMKYGLENDDPFSVVNHPWQPFVLDVHIIAAPFAVFFFAAVIGSHALQKLRADQLSHRVSGLASITLFSLMVLSGYVLQVLVNPMFRTVCLVLHLLSSIGFVSTYLYHMLSGRSRARREHTRTQDLPRNRLAA